MKILLVNTLNVGGAATACIRLHKALLKIGIDSHLLFADSFASIKASSDMRTACKNNRQRFQLEVFKLWYKVRHKQRLSAYPNAFFSFTDSAYDITKHPKYQEADIVHLHWVAHLLDYRSFFKKNTKPIVWTLHDENPFLGGPHSQTEFPDQAFLPLTKKGLAIKKVAYTNQNIQVVAPSTWMQQQSLNSDLFQKKIHVNIPNGLDTDIFKNHSKAFCREILGLPQDKKIVLFVAEYLFDTRKGINHVIETIPLLGNEIDFAIVGKDLPIIADNERVHALGYIKDERLMALVYAAADVFILPSLIDNLPNTIMESICCGTPVVAFNVGGVGDLVLHQKNGWLCEEQSATAIRNGIHKILAGELEWNRLEIREDATNRYNEKHIAGQYEKLYKEILQR